MSLGDDLKHKAEEMSDTAKEKLHQGEDAFDEKKEDMEHENATKGGEVKRDINDPLAPDEPHEYYGDKEGAAPESRPGTFDTDNDDVMEDDF